MSSTRPVGFYILSLGVIALGIAVVALTAAAPVSAIYAKIGPHLFPYMVGGVLIVLGVLLLRDAWTGNWECEANDPDVPKPDWGPVAIIVAGLFLNVLLIQRLGFILSSTIMYGFVAHAFGARRLWLAVLVGFVLALVAYYGFAQLLGLRMGGGLIEDLI